MTEHQWKAILLKEWSARLALIPEAVVHKTLQASMQHYMEIKAENWLNPTKHFCKRFHTLQFNWRNKTDAIYTIFPLVVSNQGHTCSQFFVSVTSKIWHVTPLSKEQHNHLALQEHLRTNGAPHVLVSDNASSKTSSAWTIVETSVSFNIHLNQNNLIRTQLRLRLDSFLVWSDGIWRFLELLWGTIIGVNGTAFKLIILPLSARFNGEHLERSWRVTPQTYLCFDIVSMNQFEEHYECWRENTLI